jgi:hypothetical protein|tara:strand:+ start:3380 stop:3730 length:351 start_codon:yes stop_codon:yes gene_type:complete
MANTFKVKSNAAMPASTGTPLTIYTVPSSTTTVVIGLTLCNVHSTSVTASVKLDSNTSDTETNEETFVVKDVSIPAGSSLEVLSGGKYVMQTTDILKIDCSVSAKIDATLSILEIT